MLSTGHIAVYGASGHTGRFVILDALRRGLPVLAVGRRADRLEVEVPTAAPGASQRSKMP